MYIVDKRYSEAGVVVVLPWVYKAKFRYCRM